MADLSDAIYKSLMLLRPFYGDHHTLTRFIKLCDQLMLKYYKEEPGYEFTNLTLINGILMKMPGSAARMINCDGIPEKWENIRQALIDDFADHRDETALCNELSNQTQGHNTAQDFYERCQNLLSTIMTYISLHETLQATIDAKRELYKTLTLDAFVSGLNEPVGSRVRCMRPKSIKQALQFVQEEVKLMNIQSRNMRKDNQPFRPFNFGLNNATRYNLSTKPSKMGFSFGSSPSQPPPSLFAGKPNQSFPKNAQPSVFGATQNSTQSTDGFAKSAPQSTSLFGQQTPQQSGASNVNNDKTLGSFLESLGSLKLGT